MERPALPSTVTVMKEKTVSYLKCHSRGFEKVIWPIICIAILVISILLLGVGTGTPNWVQLDVVTNTSEPRGNVTFGLLRGSHSIRYGENPLLDTIDGSYFLFDRLPLTYLIRFHIAFGCSVLAILFCVLTIAFTLLNSYQSVTTWWRGPSMMYLLSLFASGFAFGAIGVFLDHYLWELNSTFIFTSTTSLSEEDALTVGGQTTSFEYLITEQGYMSTPVLHYSIYVEMAGAGLPLLVTLLAWRLALLIPAIKPVKELQLKAENTKTNYQLKETESVQFFSAAAPEVPNPVSVGYNNPQTMSVGYNNPQTVSVGYNNPQTMSGYNNPQTMTASPPSASSIKANVSISRETQNDIFY